MGFYTFRFINLEFNNIIVLKNISKANLVFIFSVKNFNFCNSLTSKHSKILPLNKDSF
ncbi:hypothetical protein LEP1GSC045_0747 [Leptospira interrogans serovar Pomona str. Kennewicki LC82-25]|nr:hypothetical protein LEP1GSC045_0747 [Leptospira interrogans serovar Pomona str. Kennewicki LC82-25]EMN41175.1 hypothetical protein LEP1GSC085_4214 [Leptospira interrogans str. L0996]